MNYAMLKLPLSNLKAHLHLINAHIMIRRLIYFNVAHFTEPNLRHSFISLSKYLSDSSLHHYHVRDQQLQEGFGLAQKIGLGLRSLAPPFSWYITFLKLLNFSFHQLGPSGPSWS